MYGLLAGRARAAGFVCRLATILALAWPTAARADYPDYDAPPDCPSADELADKARDRLPEGSRDLPNLTVAITKHPKLYVASVTVGDDETRTLTAPTCDEIVDAIAVIVAVRAAK